MRPPRDAQTSWVDLRSRDPEYETRVRQAAERGLEGTDFFWHYLLPDSDRGTAACIDLWSAGDGELPDLRSNVEFGSLEEALTHAGRFTRREGDTLVLVTVGDVERTRVEDR